MKGSLTLFPSQRPGYPAPEVRDWDPDTGLVRVGEVFAHLGHCVTDPNRADLIVSLGWHDLAPMPQVAGRIELLLEESGRYVRDRDGAFSIAPASVKYTPVPAAKQWPEDRLEIGGPAAAGVVAGVRVTRVWANGIDRRTYSARAQW